MESLGIDKETYEYLLTYKGRKHNKRNMERFRSGPYILFKLPDDISKKEWDEYCNKFNYLLAKIRRNEKLLHKEKQIAEGRARKEAIRAERIEDFSKTNDCSR